MKRILKIFTWVMVILVGLILICGIITQTALFRTWLKEFAVSEVNDILEAELSIEEINGNLFSNTEIHNLIVSDKHDTLLILPEIHLSYNLLALLWDKIEVHGIEIIKPQIRLVEDSTGAWNFSKLISSNSIPDTALSDNDQRFGLIISVDSFSLFNGSLNFQTDNNLLPEKISHLNINLNGLYSSEEIHLILDTLSFQSEHPNFMMRRVALNFSKKEGELLIKNLFVKTGSNQFESDGKYNRFEDNYFNLSSQKLDLREFVFILPDIKLNKNPDLILSTQYNQDSIEFEIVIHSDHESLTLKGQGKNYQALFDSSYTDNILFNLHLVANNITLNHWSDHLPEAKVSGQLSINGSLIGLDDLEADISGEFHELRFQNHTVDFFRIDASYNEGMLRCDIDLRSNISNIELIINIENLNDHPAFDGTISVAHLDLGKLLLADGIRSDLNFKLHFKGENVLPPKNIATIESAWTSSQFNDLTIDTLYTEIHLSGTRYTVDTLQIRTNSGLIALNGHGDMNYSHRLKYTIDLLDLQNMADLVGADSVAANGLISGLVSGNIDSLNNEMRFDLQQVQYDDISVDSLAGNSSIHLLDSNFVADIDLSSYNIKLGDIKFENIELSSIYDSDQIISEIDIRFDSNLITALSVILRPDSFLDLTIPRIDIDVLGEQWNGKLNKLVYDTVNNDIQINELNLKCITSEDPRSIYADGMLSTTGSEDFQLKIEGIHPKNILSYLGMESKIDGRINFDLDITGTASKPVFKGDLRFEEGKVGTIRYQGVSSWFDYKDERFNFDFSLNFNGEDSLTVDGYLPLHLSLADSLDILDPDKTFDLSVRSEKIPIGLFLNNLKIVPAVSGILLCDFTLKNTLVDPKMKGYLQLKHGAIRSPYWGIDYKDIELKISALDDRFSLDKFQIISTKGTINAGGDIQLDYQKTEDKIVYSNLSLLADQFYLMQHKDFEIQISADINYHMKEGEPRVSGYIDVIRSSFYLPTMLDRAGYVTESGDEFKSALVEARDIKLEMINPQEEITVIQAQRDTLQAPGFLDLLEGNLEIRITRNTWVRNPQLRLELGGNLNMMMNKGDLFLKGPVNIIRGQYDLFGRRFTVIEGKLDFMGTGDINPSLFLEAGYVYRTVGREKRTLILKVTGDLEFPVITFLESNNPISQDDAISIILYGRKKDELSFGSQTDLEETDAANTVAMGLVSNLVSDRLTRSLGDDLKLDVIEVNATDNWQSANFVVGKYITQDIFVTYKREFGQSLNNNLYPETISMEYELSKNLFLQMIQGNPQESGYDLLFKFDWD